MRGWPLGYGSRQNSQSTKDLIRWIREQSGGKELLAHLEDDKPLSNEAYELLRDLRRMGIGIASKIAGKEGTCSR